MKSNKRLFLVLACLGLVLFIFTGIWYVLIPNLVIYINTVILSELAYKDCITPEMPYCYGCKYGHVVYSDEDYGHSGLPTDFNCECNYKYKFNLKRIILD